VARVQEPLEAMKDGLNWWEFSAGLLFCLAFWAAVFALVWVVT